MKKTVLIILAVLPIVLLVIIAFAGRILSRYQHISVERVEFIDDSGDAYGDSDSFTLEQGTSRSAEVRIYPELATNKKVIYESQDTSVCTVDGDGVVTGVHYGSTTVIAKTEDGNKTAILNVLVTADVPTKVTLSSSELSMKIGENHILSVTVEEFVAINKNVTYTSSDPSVVSVNSTGRLTAHSIGTAIITATAISGGACDTCTVTVEEGDAAISLDFSGTDAVTLINEKNSIYHCSNGTVDLMSALRCEDGLDTSDISIRIMSGSSYATLDNGILSINTADKMIKIHISAGGKELEASFMLLSD